MSQALLGTCPLHHKPFDVQRLHKRTYTWHGSAVPTQKTALPRRGRALTWTVHAKKPPSVLNECGPHSKEFIISIPLIFDCNTGTRLRDDRVYVARVMSKTWLPLVH